MNGKNILTAIIPTFNRIDKLKKSMDTYLSTTRDDIEFLILDNCSTDSTRKYIEMISKKDKRVKFYFQKKNKYFNGNTYDGFSMVKTEFGMWLADDDLMIGDYISDCINILKKYPRVGLVHNYCIARNHINQNSSIEYDYFKSGISAWNNICTVGGAFPGLCYRMSCFDLSKYPLGEDKIYSLAKMNALVALKHDIVILKKSGLMETDLQETETSRIKKKIKEQKRNPDLNIGELISYYSEVVNNLNILTFCNKITPWLLKAASNMPKEFYNKFIDEISKNLGKIYILFLFRLIVRRFHFKILYHIILNLINPKNFRFHLNLVKFFLNKISILLTKSAYQKNEKIY